MFLGIPLSMKYSAKLYSVSCRHYSVNNIRIYLDRLIWSIEELANKGVLKPPELQSISYEDFEKNPQ